MASATTGQPMSNAGYAPLPGQPGHDFRPDGSVAGSPGTFWSSGGMMPQPGGIMPQPGQLNHAFRPDGSVAGSPGTAWGIGGGGPNHPGMQVQNPGMFDGGGMLNPPVQNPGMPMLGGPGTLIDGGPVMRPAPPQGGFGTGLQKGTLAGVRDFIQAGQMGKARQAYEAGGGTWSKAAHQHLKNKYGG